MNIHTNFIIALSVLFSSSLWATDIETISRECNALKGNKIALDRFVESVEGNEVNFAGELMQLDEGGFFSDTVAEFSVVSGHIHSVSASISDQAAAQLRIRSKYRVEATVTEFSVCSYFGEDICCAGLKVNEVRFR